MAPAHYGDAVTPDQAEVTMILIMGDIYMQLYRRTDRKINRNILSAVQPLLDGH